MIQIYFKDLILDHIGVLIVSILSNKIKIRGSLTSKSRFGLSLDRISWTNISIDFDLITL
jgi:hypothetical protein